MSEYQRVKKIGLFIKPRNGVISVRGLFFSVSFFVRSLGILMIIDVLALFAAGRWRRSYFNFDFTLSY